VRDRVDLVFTALADPSRRYLLETLAARGTATPTELAGELPVTRQAVAKHLSALRSAGLVRSHRRGREHRYELDPGPLEDAAGWIARVGSQWDARLQALARHIGEPPAAH
jgi:DNA-binding transcriptional ArsR family regulator